MKPNNKRGPKDSVLAAILILTLGLLKTGTATSFGDTVEVAANRSIFSQELDLDGSIDNTSLPAISIQLPAGINRILNISDVIGSIDPNHSAHGADGGFYDGNSVNINSLGIISGILDESDFTLALLGVFTSANPASGTDPAPPRLDFTGNHNFTSLSPLLNQTFYIGDGLTGTGTGALQEFLIPDNAAYLNLGFADGAIDGLDAFNGDPGYYSDNHGSLTVTTTISGIPEPSTALFGTALFGVLGVQRKRTRGA